jgi:midasin
MVATMNPSGDFGKKELSPALRNRMTEIWVESYFHQPELVGMYMSVSASNNMFLTVPQSVDLYLIILETASDKLKSKIKESGHI